MIGIPSGAWRAPLAFVATISIFACASTPGPRDFAPAGRGLIIPLYIYPGDDEGARAAWDLVGEAARTFPDVDVIAVVNPANGPGTAADSRYRSAIRRLDRSGVILAGYVPLGYGARSLVDVNEDLRRWRDLYPRVTGFFFDEVPVPPAESGSGGGGSPLAPQVDLSAVTVRARGHAGHAGPIIANPGVPAPDYYFGRELFDLVVVHEETRWPQRDSREVPGAIAGRSALLVYGSGVWDEDALRDSVQQYGYVFVNDHARDITGTGTYPWSFLPRDLLRQVEIIAR